MRSLLFVIAFCLLTQVSRAQLNGDITYFCTYYGGNAKLSDAEVCMKFDSYENGMKKHSRMESMLDTIMEEVGLPKNYLLVECPGIQNCMAVNLQAQKGFLRYIVYDNAFMQLLDSMTTTRWATISILAHEVGHHLSGHTLDSMGSRPDKELEADRFSGFILFKLGATLAEAQAAMMEVGEVPRVTTHPPLPNRLAAIRNGWNDAWSSNYRQQKNHNEKPVLKSLEDLAVELYDKAYLDNIMGRHDDAIRSANMAIYLKKGYAEAYCERGLAEIQLGKTNAALLTLDTALLLDRSLVLAQVYKGKAHVKAKKYLAATIEFNKALKLDSGYAAIYAERAMMWNDQRMWNKAITDGDMAIELGYKDTHIPYGTVGYAFLQKKEYEESLFYFLKSLRYNPTYEFARKWGIEAEKKVEELAAAELAQEELEKKKAAERKKKIEYIKKPIKKTNN